MNKKSKASLPLPQPTLRFAFLIIFFTFLAFANSFSGVFLYDDSYYIVESERIHSLKTPQFLFSTSTRPLTDLTLAINYALGQKNVWGYHCVNFIIHAMSALTLFGIVRRTLLLPYFNARFTPYASWMAFSAAVLWSVHPLQTESVTYIVQRAESLGGLFYLLTIYGTIRSYTDQKNNFGWKLLTIFVCALGMLSKETMVTAPIVALVYVRSYILKSFREAFQRPRFLMIFLMATWGLLIILYSKNYTIIRGAGFGLKTITTWQYVLTQPGVILHYLKLSLWPDTLVFDYLWPAVTTFREAIPTLFVLGMILVLTMGAWVRYPPLGFWGLWFLIILLPSSSVIPLRDPAFEHRLYLSLAGIVTLVVLSLAQITQLGTKGSPGHLKLFQVSVIILAATLGYLTSQRNKDYHSEFAMWKDVIQKRPDNYTAYYMVGYLYEKEKDYLNAIDYYNKSIELNYQNPTVHFHLADAYFHLGNVYAELGMQDESLNHFYKVLEIDLSYKVTHYNIGNAYLNKGMNDKAIYQYRLEIAANPEYTQAYVNLGTILAQEKKYDDALRYYQKAIQLEPDNADIFHNLGSLYAIQGKKSEALAYYEKALQLKPDYESARENLQQLLAESD